MCNVAKVSAADLNKLLSKELIEKLTENLLMNPGADGFLLCPDCEIPYAKSYAAQIELNCQKCDKSWCMSCRSSPYHYQETCEEHMNSADKLREKKMLEECGVRQCEKCGNGIERNGGCKHMKCSACGWDFCWNCGTEFCGYGNIC